MTNQKAQAAKEKGNIAFKAGDYPTSIGHYTSAILADRDDPTYPLNRAAAYLKLGKAEDAERDCNTVLGMNPRNVKALFRRGQARIGMNQLLEAHKDFSDILVVEPSNVAAQDELKKVVGLIQAEKARKAKSPTNTMGSSLEPNVAPKRRRVPIKIIDPSQPAASSSPIIPERAAQVLTKPASVAPKAATDTLEAISSRSLKDDTPPVPPALSAAAAALKPESVTSPTTEPKASSFKDAKQVRETTKPSRVGGGIFRASGKNTIFTTKDGEVAASQPASTTPVKTEKSDPSTPAQSQAPANKARETLTTPAPVNTASPAPPVVVKAPATLFDFNKAWTNARSTEEKWQLLNTISPTQFPEFCKSSMEAELFSSVLSVFVDVLSSGDTTIKVTVLARAEKAVANKVWELLGVQKPTGAWAPVA